MENDFCRAQNQTNLQCYYEPWTSCSIKDALGELNMMDLKAMGHRYNMNQIIARMEQKHDFNARAMLVTMDEGATDGPLRFR